MKALKFIYQENEIHFAFNPMDDNVMINATEMARIFNKRTGHFLKADHTKKYVKLLEQKIKAEQTPNGVRSELKVIENRGQNGTYFHRKLALKFAVWLDIEFELWVYDKIDEIIFGQYKKHIEAHKLQLKAKSDMQILKDQLLDSESSSLAIQYFEAEKIVSSAKTEKTKAIRNQLSLFNN